MSVDLGLHGVGLGLGAGHEQEPGDQKRAALDPDESLAHFLTDGRGETAWFSESVIIFTSNLGAAEAPANALDVPGIHGDSLQWDRVTLGGTRTATCRSMQARAGVLQHQRP